jgi:Immunity protein 42
MIFGSDTLFGIEVDLEKSNKQNSSGAFGKIRLWLYGQQIGDYSVVVHMSVPVRWFWQTLGFRGTRTDLALAGMPADVAIQFLESRLFQSSGSIEEADVAVAEFSRYCICPNNCESFDGEWLGLIELAGKDRAIWRGFESGIVGEVELPIGYYDEIVKELVDWFQSETGFHPSSLEEHLR